MQSDSNDKKEKHMELSCWIDKTKALERAISRYPALYIQGAAASGKSTAVRMLLKKHPEVAYQTFCMDEEDICTKMPEHLKLLEDCRNTTAPYWIIFENLPSGIPEELVQSLADFVWNMPENRKAVFVSRDKVPEKFLNLIWKRQMEIVSQKELLFSLRDIQELTEKEESLLSAKELYQITGGWAGCVDVMIRLSNQMNGRSGSKYISAGELRKRYEIDTYIRQEILCTLPKQEQRIMEIGSICPWINEKLIEEVYGADPAYGILKDLEQKGLLQWMEQKKYWKIAPLFSQRPSEWMVTTYGNALERWYEEHGFLKEALWYCRQFFDEREYCACLIRHYEKIPFSGISYTAVLKSKDHSPEAAYLRGMCYRESGNFRKMSQEAAAIGPKHPEIYLNLMFANPEVSLSEWLEIVRKLSKEQEQNECGGKFRLYEILGYSHTYLCGVRELSGMFACTKREENSIANLWKTAFGDMEWRAYCLARIDYYLKTDRRKSVNEKDEKLLFQYIQPSFLDKLKNSDKSDCMEQERKNGVVALYQYCLLQIIETDEEQRNSIHQLADALCRTEDPVCVRNAEALMGVFSYALGNQKNLGYWLLKNESREDSSLTCSEILFRIRGYLMLHQYGKADRLLQKILPYLKKFRMTSLYAEALFQQAVVNWNMEQRGLALQNVIESFLVNGSNRFVGLYTIYGTAGVEILEAYIEWMQNNMPGGWKRKKKYNYGNVLRMPVEDYLDVVLRRAKRNTQKGNPILHPRQEESLTMMENIVLQAICQGLSNAEIGEQQNLKITTVKSHIYNIYKKLGVKNRMQAALKGKELGIV